MSNPKTQTQGNNNTIYNKRLQWQHGSQGEKQTPTANYTLPGVINYLTSEFTNLERFKIMTNLEISEMKYRIMQLHGELNSAKYINEKQKLRIEELEKENKRLNGIIEGTEDLSIGNDESQLKDIEIPEVDLSVITKSRDQLTASMKEVMTLLKVPSKAFNNFNLEELSASNHYQDLVLEDNNDFPFIPNNKENSDLSEKRNKETIFSQYLKPNNANENTREDAEEDKAVDDALQSIFEKKIPVDDSSVESKINSDYESDADTVLFDPNDMELSIVPEATIEYKHKNYQFSKIDSNDAYISYLNYDENFEVPISEFTVWSSISNELILSVAGIIPFVDNPSKIVQIYTFSCTKTNGNVILIYNSGIIEHFFVSDGKFTTKSRNIHLASNSSVFSTDIVEVSKLSDKTTKAFGLILNTGTDEITDLKVSHLIVDTDTNEIELIEMGAYNPEFFKSLVQGDLSDHFLYAHWFKDLASDPSDQIDNGSNAHSNYSHYSIILKLSTSLILLNIESNRFDVLYEYNSAEDHYKGLTTSNYKLLIEAKSNGGSYQAKVLDIFKKDVVSSADVNSPSLVVVESSGNPLIVELIDEKLVIYDTSFQQKRCITVDGSIRIDTVSSKILLYSSSNILRVYEISDLFKVA